MKKLIRLIQLWLFDGENKMKLFRINERVMFSIREILSCNSEDWVRARAHNNCEAKITIPGTINYPYPTIEFNDGIVIRDVGLHHLKSKGEK